MTLTWRARRLIVGLAALTALFDLAVLLPGNPYYSSRDGFVAAVAIQALVLWGLWRGSVVAWVVALAFAVLTFVSLVLMQATLEVGVFLILVVSVAQAAILCTARSEGTSIRADEAYTSNGSRAVGNSRSTAARPLRDFQSTGVVGGPLRTR
jgi:hypothetical protein